MKRDDGRGACSWGCACRAKAVISSLSAYDSPIVRYVAEDLTPKLARELRKGLKQRQILKLTASCACIVGEDRAAGGGCMLGIQSIYD